MRSLFISFTILTLVAGTVRGFPSADLDTYDLDNFDEVDAFYDDDFSQSLEEASKIQWYATFKDLKKAAMGGRQLEAYIRIDQCQQPRQEDERAPTSKAVFVQKLVVWQWMTQYKSLYDGEVIVMPAHQVNWRGAYTNEEFVVMSNGTVMWAISPVGNKSEPIIITCSLGSSASFRSTDPSRKKMKSGSDAISAVLKGRYTNGVVAIVDYSKCQRIDDGVAPVNVINGGLIDDHLVMESRPAGPLQLISTWFYVTHARPGGIAAAGNDFVLSQDGTVIVDSFSIRNNLNTTVDVRFKCALNNGVDYYF